MTHDPLGCTLAYQKALRDAVAAVDNLAAEMANWSSEETQAATNVMPDLTAEQWMWAQRGVYRALATIKSLQP